MNISMFEIKFGYLVLILDVNWNCYVRLMVFVYIKVVDLFVVFYSDLMGIWKKFCVFL